ncbi:MAG: hypothetical protein INR64_15495 [Caulobacteraceae bacterium]|nr:hypothetical protein [Caulobacter sp.]
MKKEPASIGRRWKWSQAQMFARAGGKILPPRGNPAPCGRRLPTRKPDVLPMPTDPDDPSSPQPSTNLYRTTAEAPKGGGGVFFAILLLLLLGGAAAYYFLFYKPAGASLTAIPTASATPAQTPAPAAAASTPQGYSNAQREQYIKQAEAEYNAVAGPKLQAFADSMKAFLGAGGISAVGLTSKDAITARRNLIAQCQQTNTDYEDFVKTEEQTYKADLQKTPLIATDVRDVFDDFQFKAQTPDNIKLRDLQRDSLKTSDDLLAYLEKTYGSWSVNAQQHLTFKPGVAAPFNAIAKTYNDQAAAINQLQTAIKAAVNPNNVAPGASPAVPAAAASVPPASVAPSPSATP